MFGAPGTVEEIARTKVSRFLPELCDDRIVGCGWRRPNGGEGQSA
jgi:hypothetical protein